MGWDSPTLSWEFGRLCTLSTILEERELDPPHWYGISNRRLFQEVPVSRYLTALFQSPAHLIQLREKDLPREENRGLVRKGAQLASERGKIFLVNTDWELAIQERVDGAHLTSKQDLVAACRLRTESGLQRFVLGQSVHSIPEAVCAERQGADYVLLAPIFNPISKRPQGPALGLAALQEASESVSIPVFGLGGITHENARQTIDTGAFGVAGISWVNDHVRRLLHAT